MENATGENLERVDYYTTTILRHFSDRTPSDGEVEAPKRSFPVENATGENLEKADDYTTTILDVFQIEKPPAMVRLRP